MKRPTETLSFAVGIAVLIAYIFGLQDDTYFVAALIGVLSGLPAAITWLVTLIRNDSS